MPSLSLLRRRFIRCLSLATVALVAVVTPAAAAALADAVEFYNATLDHYFVTAAADEISKLDNGFFVGWKRTGQSFKVQDAATTGTSANPVCRFYGSPTAGLDSHFYSASPTECDEVKQKFPGAWLLESMDVFQVFLPNTTTGACPSGTTPIYRTWNGRSDSNHRYTTDFATQQAMIAKGYIAEGYGPTPVVMCSPQVAPGTVPACQLIASNGSPQVGTQVTLTSSCTGNPTAFNWTGCNSVTSACTASASVAVPQTYTLVASNAAGPSVPASITLNWIAPPPPEPPPVCSLVVTAQSETPTVNGLVSLIASCTGTPTAYAWTNCTSSTNVCLVRKSTAGAVVYSVTASNGSGSGSASAPVTWVATAAPPAGQCGSFPSALYTSVGSSSASAYTTFFGDSPAFAWNGVWAIKFTVPGTAGPGQFGSLLAAEFGGPPTFREATVSRTACDFRATDLSGNAGPLGRAVSNTVSLPFGIGANSASLLNLTPGQTYYFNIRNYLPSNGTITCTAAQVRCDALATISLPH